MLLDLEGLKHGNVMKKQMIKLLQSNEHSMDIDTVNEMINSHQKTLKTMLVLHKDIQRMHDSYKPKCNNYREYSLVVEESVNLYVSILKLLYQLKIKLI